MCFQYCCWVEIEKQCVLLCWVEKLLRSVHVNIISPFGKSKSYLTKYRLYSNKALGTWFSCLKIASSASVHMPAFPGWPKRVGSNDTRAAGDPCPAGDAAALDKGSISQHLEITLDVCILVMLLSCWGFVKPHFSSFYTGFW